MDGTFLFLLIGAAVRGRTSTLAIFVLNLLLGWTFIGWAIALVWAFTKDHVSSRKR